MGKIILTFIISMFVCMPPITSHAEESIFLTTTTEDIGRPYTVIDGVCVHMPVLVTHGLLGGGDMHKGAIQDAYNEVAKIAKKAGADALVAFDMDYASGSENSDSDRFILCGTLVKFRE